MARFSPYMLGNSQRILVSAGLAVAIVGVASALVFRTSKTSEPTTLPVTLTIRAPLVTTTARVAGEKVVAKTSYQLFADDVFHAKQADSSVVALQFFGDIMLDRNVAKAMGTKGLDYIFEKVKDPDNQLFGAADLLIANLEGPFAPRRMATSKEIAFRFDPALAKELKFHGFTAFNLANNHVLDMGRFNAAFTRKVLTGQGLGHFGDELLEGKIFTWVATTTPERVAFLGFHATYRRPDRIKAAAALADAHRRARYVIVNVHWGIEYSRTSTPQQQEFAHWLIDKGADAVIGHHPHVVEEMEMYKGKPIFYSLGNFIFDQYFSAATQEGLSVGLILSGGKIQSVHLIPFHSKKSQVQLMAGKRREKFLEWMNKNSRLDDRSIINGIVSLSTP